MKHATDPGLISPTDGFGTAQPLVKTKSASYDLLRVAYHVTVASERFGMLSHMFSPRHLGAEDCKL